MRTGRTSRARAPGTSSNFAGLRMPARTRSSGSRASASTSARPIPRLAPVTSAVRPERSMVLTGAYAPARGSG